MMPQAAPNPTPGPRAQRQVFVYGTLRRGGSNDISRYRPLPVFLGRAEIAGTLYDLGACPGARLGGEGRIQGEVYAITKDVEDALDRLEEVRDDDSGEYVKRELLVWGGEASWPCLVYEIQRDRLGSAPVIAGGDWLSRG